MFDLAHSLWRVNSLESWIPDRAAWQKGRGLAAHCMLVVQGTEGGGSDMNSFRPHPKWPTLSNRALHPSDTFRLTYWSALHIHVATTSWEPYLYQHKALEGTYNYTLNTHPSAEEVYEHTFLQYVSKDFLELNHITNEVRHTPRPCAFVLPHACEYWDD